MSKETYSVQALVVENGKQIKSTLTLFMDRYEFNDIQNPIDWEHASYNTGTTKVKSFLFTSEKPHVVITDGENQGPAFVMEQSQVEQVIKVITEFGERVRQHRIEEEERKRLEEERERTEKEEHKRKEEEKRKRLEEEERMRKEEEERKRKEDEQRRKIELAIKIQERERRINEEVKEAKTSAEQVDLSNPNNPNLKKAWGYITENPYRILGISVSSTIDEANTILDKLKKLTRLNALDSYTSDFHLNGSNKPTRDIGIIQNAVTMTKEIKYKWFWFTGSDACTAWQNMQYREELLHDGPDYGSYDMFLANYFYGLVFDPCFTKTTLWKPVFFYYAFICSDCSHAIIKSRFNEKELVQLRVLDAVRSFKEEVFKPVEVLCDTDDVDSIIRLYKILKMLPDTSLDGLMKSVEMKLTNWFSIRERTVCNLISQYDSDEVINSTEAARIKAAGNIYLREVEDFLEPSLEVVQKGSVRYAMIKESYRLTTWQLMSALDKTTEKSKAVFYANKCYPYCNEDDKRSLRIHFGVATIKGADVDATDTDWDIMGDNYFEGKNGYSQNYNEAFKWYKKAAEAGNIYSQNSLGICYRDGYGVDISVYDAAKWFEIAYRNGSPDGAYNLAELYTRGDRKLKQKAIDLYLEAAKMGHPTALDSGKALLDWMAAEQKEHRMSQHEHYDLGFLAPIAETIIVEVELNYSANIYLLEDENYEKYLDCDDYTYYGGLATVSPYRIKIPHSGFWHLAIDNGDDDMTGIITSVYTRTIRD